MPAVIQRLVTPEGETFPTVMSACRVDDLFADEEWEWDCDRDRAFVFATYEQAEKQARALGSGAYPAIRAAAESEAPAPVPQVAMVATQKPTVARGVSPAAMAAGDTKARIAAAKQNKRVTAQRRTAADWQRVYEETARRLGEHE